MRRIAVVIATLLAIVGLVFASYGTETIITTGGSVLTGVIESGLPATVSITSDTGDVFTVQRTNMKHMRFSRDIRRQHYHRRTGRHQYSVWAPNVCWRHSVDQC